MARMPAVQDIVLPILRIELDPVMITDWIPNTDHRVFPFVNVRRVGGVRHETRPFQLDKPVIEMTAYGKVGLAETEELYADALEALYEAVSRQTQTTAGYLHSIKETMGATQFSSLFQDSWRVQGLIQLGVRPPRS